MRRQQFMSHTYSQPWGEEDPSGDAGWHEACTRNRVNKQGLWEAGLSISIKRVRPPWFCGEMWLACLNNSTGQPETETLSWGISRMWTWPACEGGLFGEGALIPGSRVGRRTLVRSREAPPISSEVKAACMLGFSFRPSTKIPSFTHLLGWPSPCRHLPWSRRRNLSNSKGLWNCNGSIVCLPGD